jgi:hypothetical protein
MEEEGIEPVESRSANSTPTPYSPTKPLQNNTLAASTTPVDSGSSTDPQQYDNIVQQPKCVHSVCRKLPADLTKVVAAWIALTRMSGVRIVAMVGQE